MNEWTATKNSGSKYQERRRVRDNLGHHMEPYPSSWLKYCVALIVCQYHSSSTLMEASSSMESQSNQFTVSSTYYVFSLHFNGIYNVYVMYLHRNSTYYYSVVGSGQPQQRSHRVWQGICLATPGNDARRIQGSYRGPHIRVACRAANTALLLVH